MVQVLLRWQVRTALGKVTLARFRVLDHVENTVRSDDLHLGIAVGGFGLDARSVARGFGLDTPPDALQLRGRGLDRCKLDPKSLPGPNLKILAGPDRD